MARTMIGFWLFVGSVFAIATAWSQPPMREKGGRKGPPPYQLGKVLPPFVRDALELTDEQKRQIADLERDVRVKLSAILTAEQKRTIEEAAPKGPPDGKGKDKGFEKEGGPGEREPKSFWSAPRSELTPMPPEFKPTERLVSNYSFERIDSSGMPDWFQCEGNVRCGELKSFRGDLSGRGVCLDSAPADGHAARGSLTTTVDRLRAEDGRWFRFRIRGFAQEGFRVSHEALTMKVEFFSHRGQNALDSVGRQIYPQIERERKDLRDAGHPLGAETWHSYTLEFRTPFVEVDTLKLSVSFDEGNGIKGRSAFWISEFELTRLAQPADHVPSSRSERAEPVALKDLVHLGGRWYFDPRGNPDPPVQFDHSNSDRLFYRAGRFETPFADNMSAWLRPGYLDRTGALVKEDRFVPDNLVIRFTKTHLVMHSKNLPNHPTGAFPDSEHAIDGNPNVIQERANTWYLPLEPKENPNHIAMDARNTNRALPMGPIGVAVNGVVFFNPFDHLQGAEALKRLDRCCGHPGPGSDYHYHKYPVCVKTPWTDDGRDHSPLIGFAFDGLPIYGPYEKEGEMAQYSRDHPLNAFNAHYDEVRGWHYHVTPGKYPHIIGGYWAVLDRQNVQRKN